MGATERVTRAVTRLERGPVKRWILILVLVIQIVPLFGTSDKLSSYYFKRRVESRACLALQLCGQFFQSE